MSNNSIQLPAHLYETIRQKAVVAYKSVFHHCGKPNENPIRCQLRLIVLGEIGCKTTIYC